MHAWVLEIQQAAGDDDDGDIDDWDHEDRDESIELDILQPLAVISAKISNLFKSQSTVNNGHVENRMNVHKPSHDLCVCDPSGR